jgi:hypothetical protein
MACAETPLPSLTSTGHMIQTLCYCAHPCAVKLSRNEPSRELKISPPPPRVTPDLPNCTIFLVKTGFLYAQVPFRTDATVFCPQITEWVSTAIAIGWHTKLWVTLVPLGQLYRYLALCILTCMWLWYVTATLFSATVVLYAL